MRRVRIIYEGEQGPITTDVVSNDALINHVQADPVTGLPTNDNRKKSAIEL